MSDFAAFCPVVNRPDLLQNVIRSVGDLSRNFTVIDNSEDGWAYDTLTGVQVFRPMVPFTFSQTMNFEMLAAKEKGKRFCFHMHSDAIIPPGATERLLEFVRQIPYDKKWAVVYTLYDVLAVYNPDAIEAFGGYDTNLPAYFSDNDWYYRARLAGWDLMESHIEIGHVGSQTINSDPYLQHVNAITFPLYRTYYMQKWGGEPGAEQFKQPFGCFPLTRNGNMTAVAR
jgi:hypothetical protein